MLYDFKNEHPEININQFLSKTSKFFQQYISRGLEEVQAEKDGRILRDGEYNYVVKSEWFTKIGLGRMWRDPAFDTCLLSKSEKWLLLGHCTFIIILYLNWNQNQNFEMKINETQKKNAIFKILKS